ncbi:DUF3987 domain-containing protein [Nocardioides silvaticus]|nr:DUF3987 domain-containing protein [Nocardioides silvaticus]
MTSPTNDSSISINDVALVVRLPHDLRDALKERAAAEDRSVASLIRVAARAYLNRRGRPVTVTQDAETNSPALASDETSFELLGRLRLARRLESRDRAPELDNDALHGLAGQVVRALAPLTEASAPAMLLTLLVTFGAMVGRSAHVNVGHQKHYPLLFGVVVGSSARARKGTSAAAVRPVLDAADEDFMTTRHLRGGIQSGEALIQALASLAEDGEVDLDQRLLLTEEEYGRLLTIAGRQGSIVSAVLRSAWDGDALSARTKAQTLIAEQPHLSVLGHVTIGELKVVLKPVDIANGYANRFIHVLSHRGTLLPEPGRLTDAQIELLGARLRASVNFARSVGEVKRSADFRRHWDTLYRIVESQPSGGEVYDSLTVRASPQMLRLATIYALLDQSPALEAVHLRAAAALWEYSEASVAHIWGATLGDERVDRLYSAVKAAGADGLDRTQVSELFGKNKTKSELDDLVARLIDLDLVVLSTHATGGRPRQVITATG